MNKQKLIIIGVLIATAISIASVASFDIPSEDYVYTQSDITKANPKLMVSSGLYTMLDNIKQTKNTILLTVSGTVLSVGDPINWYYQGDTYGSVPVTIEIDKKTKDMETKLQLKKGDEFTFYLGGFYQGDQHFIHGYEPQFELGEKTIIHVGKSDQGPVGPDGDNYFVELGEFGKYKVVGDKAYNEKYPDGKSLDKAFNEAK